MVDSNGHTHIVAVTGNNLQIGVGAALKLKNADSTQPNAFVEAAALMPLETVVQTVSAIRAVVNAAGHVMAVWTRNKIVGAALYTPGVNPNTAGTWSLLPTRIQDFAASSGLEADVAAVGNGAFEFVWRQRIGSNGAYDVMSRRYTINNNTLSAIVPIEASTADNEAPRLVVDSAGNMLAAWRQPGVGTVINRRATGAAWGTTTTTVAAPNLVFEALKVNAAGRGVLLNSDRAGLGYSTVLDIAAPNPVVQASAYTLNAHSSAPDAYVAADHKIRVYGVAVNVGAGNSSILAEWVYTWSSGWSSANLISDNNTNNLIATGQGVFGPRVSEADSAGNLMLTWEERGANSASTIRTRRLLNGNWRPISFAPSDRVAGEPQREATAVLGADGSGMMICVDQQTRNLRPANFR